MAFTLFGFGEHTEPKRTHDELRCGREVEAVGVEGALLRVVGVAVDDEL